MFADLSLATVGQLSPYGIAVIFVLLIATGRLVSKTTLDREVGDWKHIADLREESNRKLLDQQAKFAELTFLAYKTIPAAKESSDAPMQ